MKPETVISAHIFGYKDGFTKQLRNIPTKSALGEGKRQPFLNRVQVSSLFSQPAAPEAIGDVTASFMPLAGRATPRPASRAANGQSFNESYSATGSRLLKSQS